MYEPSVGSFVSYKEVAMNFPTYRVVILFYKDKYKQIKKCKYFLPKRIINIIKTINNKYRF